MKKLLGINPTTEEIIWEYTAHTQKEIIEIVEKSHRAFHQWRKIPLKDRLENIKNLAQNLRQNKRKYAELITIEMGKPITEAIAEIEKCALLCEFYYENSEEYLSPQTRKGALNHAKENYVVFEPLGVILTIMPWNFPFWQVLRFSIPTLIAGNTVILKHSPNVSRIALVLEKIMLESGMMENVFRSILVHQDDVSEVTELILSMPQVQGVSVTGSVRAGKSVAQISGRYIKKSVLELGGSDPFIVLDDANIEEAASTAALARCQNTGQSCIAAKRFIIMDSIYDKFMELFLQQMELYSQNIGDPLKETTRIGPIARRDLLENIIHQVDEAVKKGAKVLLGGERPNIPKGFFYRVTVLENIHQDMPIYREEIFGPVAMVFRAKNLENALHLANDTYFGLGVSIWTTDYKKVKNIMPELFFGNVFVNGMVKSDPGFPFGGVKESGYGRELSLEGIREFTNIKTIRIY
ncbi:MAG: NAD-dependent succinate-semialdehyde dehydrogenase [Leptospiraceae bacterium]|nr:NAD-dependent succinate-semialdehyde dehydrogenase [Leptospiraceae bacterium]MDW7976435.1 NAD-dependent succinate-semialdehyde dehydrogenase [Leptospiraceae bacterium]